MLNFSFQKSLLVGAHWQDIDLGLTMESYFHKFFITLLADIACICTCMYLTFLFWYKTGNSTNICHNIL